MSGIIPGASCTTLFLTIAMGVLPFVGFFLGQYTANKRFKIAEDKKEAAIQPPKTISPVQDRPRGSSHSSEFDIEEEETTDAMTSLSDKSLPTFNYDRKGDLDFYKTMLRKRIGTQVFEFIWMKNGLESEAEFLDRLEDCRADILLRVNELLQKYFHPDSKKRLTRKEYPFLSKKCLECQKSFVKGKAIRTSAITIFEEAERDTYLLIGDTIFPNYRQNIQGFVKSVNSALRNISLEKLRKSLYDELWERDPELISSYHVQPPQPKQFSMKGRLRITQSRKKHPNSMRTADFSISLLPNKPKNPHGIAKFVLMTPGEPIHLADAKVTRDRVNAETFHIKGQSAINPKHSISLTLMADSPSSCEQWVKCLTRFHRSKENASMNVAMVINYLLQFARCFETHNYTELEALADHCSDSVIEKGIMSFRVALPLSFRSVLFKAAGSENWDDIAFKTVTGWVGLLMKGNLELKLKERSSHSVESEKFKKRGSCAVM